MPWTYDPAQLLTNPIYQIRAEIQDTDFNDPQLLDEEIAYAIAAERNMWAAAARCAEMIGRRQVRRADVKLGRSLQILYAKAAEQYFNMARMLRTKAMGTIAPYVGGMLDSDKETIMSNSSLVAPMFTKTMMQNPWVGGYTTDSVEPVTNADSNINPEDDFI